MNWSSERRSMVSCLVTIIRADKRGNGWNSVGSRFERE